MAERVLDPRIKALYDRGISPYSFSRLESINNCLYGAYKTYILHEKGEGNIYSFLGSNVHDVLEKITNGEATEANLLPAMHDELENMRLLGFEFPKDFRGEDSIRTGWITDMENFCKTYKAPEGKFSTEELFIYKSPKGRYLIGYIDLQKLNENGSISIYDYKTSTMYRGNDLKSHGRQLVIYQLGLEQMGKVVSSAAWMFLKYVEIKFMGYKTSKSKKKTEITKVIERKKIASEMSAYIEADMVDAGYDDIEIDIALTEFKRTNMFESLPQDIQSKYKVSTYICKYDVTDEVKKECENYIDSTIDMWEALNDDDEREYAPREFAKIQKSGKVVDDYFFCVNLCQHKKTCKFIKDYLDSKNEVNEEEFDLF